MSEIDVTLESDQYDFVQGERCYSYSAQRQLEYGYPTDITQLYEQFPTDVDSLFFADNILYAFKGMSSPLTSKVTHLVMGKEGDRAPTRR